MDTPDLLWLVDDEDVEHSFLQAIPVASAVGPTHRGANGKLTSCGYIMMIHFGKLSCYWARISMSRVSAADEPDAKV